MKRQVESQGRDFTAHGGFTERLYATRAKARDAEDANAPVCPLCGKPMRQRTARKGSLVGQPFWGCSGYPDCRGIRKMSDRSDKSDGSDKADLGATP